MLTAPIVPPAALLLDFGGVLVDGPVRADRVPVCAAELHAWLTAAGQPVPGLDQVTADLAAGLAALNAWSEAMCRPPAPAEVGAGEFWADFVAADWPAEARAALRARGDRFSRRLGQLSYDWALLPGIVDLLTAATDRAVRLAVVSNTMYGGVHREFLARVGVADRFGAQLYSDEAGVRKPNPELIWRAARALDVSPGDCWFVGDTWTRDVRCGRQAGVGAVVLMTSGRTAGDPVPAGLTADYRVPDAAALGALLGWWPGRSQVA